MTGSTFLDGVIVGSIVVLVALLVGFWAGSQQS